MMDLVGSAIKPGSAPRVEWLKISTSESDITYGEIQLSQDCISEGDQPKMSPTGDRRIRSKQALCMAERNEPQLPGPT